jgi:CcmD family protein
VSPLQLVPALSPLRFLCTRLSHREEDTMGYVVAAYAVAWVGIFGYLGWIALRLRGASTELAAVQDQLREEGREPQ